ncbi:MAG TPA: hypothetical protein DDZ80_17610 [Cyanobacteria bacterium UBA8803]|nr:hypothetical protein [Cyanobacteria bacterium UBA9273]HBL60205.1 hypothetical protein [Cyanobacteria bacterium UBA8803]
MSAASRYWTMIGIDASGGRKIEEIGPAKVFFLAAFPEFSIRSEVPDALVQRQLLYWFSEGILGYQHESLCQQAGTTGTVQVYEPLQNNDRSRRLAQICLKCFISSQIERVCQRLATQFGDAHGFTYRDLLPCVLNDDSRRYITEATIPPSTSYQSFLDEILHSYDPEQSSLATWTTRRVKHHKEINAFLLEHGVYLVSDWAILNDTTAKQLERIFSQFHQLTRFEIQEAKQLLESYHAVYRAQRLKQRQAGIKGTCSPPTPEQLHQINQRLFGQTPQMLSGATVMRKLREIASQLRSYRIYVRGGSLPKQENDPSDLAESLPYSDSDAMDDQTQFLTDYRHQLLTCLDQAIAQVTSERVAKLQRKDPQKAEKFLAALQIFHCQERSMSEIAELLGLKAQFHVSRLLQLKAFRADVQQQLLVLLRDRVINQAQAYADPQRLQTWNQQIEEALNEQVAKLIEEAATEASTATVERNQAPSSLFTQRLCRYLDIRSKQS